MALGVPHYMESNRIELHDVGLCLIVMNWIIRRCVYALTECACTAAAVCLFHYV